MTRKLITLLLLGLNLALIPALATAHGTNYYSLKWPVNVSPPYNIDNNVPIAHRAGIQDGVANFSNRASGNGPDFTYAGVTTTTNDFNPCEGSNAVYSRENLAAVFGQPAESVLGVTQVCSPLPTDPSRITRFQMTFETTANGGTAVGWNPASTAPGPNQWDLRSIVAHEAGHATGLVGGGNGGHFPNDADGGTGCPFNAAIRNTMCAGWGGALGTAGLRTLEEHDLHTINGAY